uniref:Transmembrane protein n=1 Tax=Pithovirus LCPAC406 TaxID=2506599 RepID=A0A481ZCT1_9VIRU|nr:MAG: uncharacterized protein LCPAC406_00670 [Pithovirus LCPAC406]
MEKRKNKRMKELNKLDKFIKAKESHILYDVLVVYYLLMTFLLAIFPILTDDFSLWNTLKTIFNIIIWFIYIPSVSMGLIFFTIYVLCGINIILTEECSNIIVVMIIINFFVSIVKDIFIHLIEKYCIT